MFGEYVAQCHSNQNQKFQDQFVELHKLNANLPTTVGKDPSMKKLHRFGNITVYDDNRVVLEPIEGHTECQRSFINASYVTDKKRHVMFVATQGPLPKTVIDFWRMVWQEKSQTIVMLTNLVEGRGIKCHQYWPENEPEMFGPFLVTLRESQVLADYTIREFTLKLTTTSEPELNVTQFHFTAWPDHGVPDYATSLLAFHRKFKKYHREFMEPITIHCSAGVGRTGTLIAIDCVLDQLEEEKMVDIAGVIIHLRTQRMKMVQSPEQFIFIHDAILEFILCGNTQVDAGNFHSCLKDISRSAPNAFQNEFEKQFMVLDKISPKPEHVVNNVAQKYPDKNRTAGYLPGDKWRVILMDTKEDYINAVFVNGYKRRRAFIIAQSPMESTARDFWKMIYDNKCGIIVMLCDIIENGQEVCHQYWSLNSLAQFGEFTVDVMKEKDEGGYFTRKITLYNVKTSQTHMVMQLQMVNWSPDGSCSNLITIARVINAMTEIQMKSGNHPIIVHCSDTMGRSGMFCAIATTIERCKTEGVVDVFQVVKALRVQKPGAVVNVAQYRLLFEAVAVYLKSFDTYSNFSQK